MVFKLNLKAENILIRRLSSVGSDENLVDIDDSIERRILNNES